MEKANKHISTIVNFRIYILLDITKYKKVSPNVTTADIAYKKNDYIPGDVIKSLKKFYLQILTTLEFI